MGHHSAEKQNMSKYYHWKAKIHISLLMCVFENETSLSAGSAFMAPSSSTELLTVWAGKMFKSDSKVPIFHEKFLLKVSFERQKSQYLPQYMSRCNLSIYSTVEYITVCQLRRQKNHKYCTIYPQWGCVSQYQQI